MNQITHQQFVIYAILLGVAAVCMLLLWWCPYFEARKRKHSRLDAIWATTFLSIVLPFLWFVAMIWAYTEDNRPRKR